MAVIPPPSPPSNPESVVRSTSLAASELYSVAVAMLPLSAGPYGADDDLHASSGYGPIMNSSEVCAILPMSLHYGSITDFAHYSSPPRDIKTNYPDQVCPDPAYADISE